MIVKMIQNLEIEMESQINSLETRIEKMQARFNKDLEEIKKSQYIMNNAISEVAQSCPTLCYPMNHSTPGLPVHHQLPEFTQTYVHRVSDAIQPSHPTHLCHPLLLLPPIPPSIRVFSNESPLYMRWPKYWSFNFSIIPSKEHPEPISFRMDWLDLLAVQGLSRVFSNTTVRFCQRASSGLKTPVFSHGRKE